MFIVFGKSYCPYCNNTVKVLKDSRKRYIYLPLEEENNQKYVEELIILGLIPKTYNTIPKIIKYKKNKGKSKFIGGYEELVDYFYRK